MAMRKLLSLFLLVGCHQMTFYAPTPSGFVARGQEIFNTEGIGAVPYACVDCHTTEPEETPSLRVANSLYNTASRESWYGGEFKTRAAQGAQYCLTERMQANPLTGDDLEAMQSFLQSISPARRLPPLSSKKTEIKNAEIAQEEINAAAKEMGLEGPQADGLARGRMLYLLACDKCHNETRKLGPPLKELSRPLEELTKVVRNGKGTMPGFSVSRLSTADLNTIAAYLSWATQNTK
jgi:cytochrome c553